MEPHTQAWRSSPLPPSGNWFRVPITGWLWGSNEIIHIQTLCKPWEAIQIGHRYYYYSVRKPKSEMDILSHFTLLDSKPLRKSSSKELILNPAYCCQCISANGLPRDYDVEWKSLIWSLKIPAIGQKREQVIFLYQGKREGRGEHSEGISLPTVKLRPSEKIWWNSYLNSSTVLTISETLGLVEATALPRRASLRERRLLYSVSAPVREAGVTKPGPQSRSTAAVGRNNRPPAAMARRVTVSEKEQMGPKCRLDLSELGIFQSPKGEETVHKSRV